MTSPTVTSSPPSSVYVLGHEAHELERLQLQSEIIGGVTQRLIRECGIGRGMRVLDIGCGAGDVSLLLAAAVGDSGHVTAFDRGPRAVEMARGRAAAAGYRNIEFVVTSDDALPERPPFDAAFGRCVLIHQTNPAAMIRRAAAAVRPGGIVAFHEVALHLDSHTRPVVELYREMDRRMIASFRALLPHHDVGGRLVDCFAEAGLPFPGSFGNRWSTYAKPSPPRKPVSRPLTSASSFAKWFQADSCRGSGGLRLVTAHR